VPPPAAGPRRSPARCPSPGGCSKLRPGGQSPAVPPPAPSHLPPSPCSAPGGVGGHRCPCPHVPLVPGSAPCPRPARSRCGVLAAASPPAPRAQLGWVPAVILGGVPDFALVPWLGCIPPISGCFWPGGGGQCHPGDGACPRRGSPRGHQVGWGPWGPPKRGCPHPSDPTSSETGPGDPPSREPLVTGLRGQRPGHPHSSTAPPSRPSTHRPGDAGSSSSPSTQWVSLGERAAALPALPLPQPSGGLQPPPAPCPAWGSRGRRVQRGRGCPCVPEMGWVPAGGHGEGCCCGFTPVSSSSPPSCSHPAPPESGTGTREGTGG